MRPRFIFDQPTLNKSPHKKRLGTIGESLACEYLARHGYTIVERNFRKRYGELDIVAVLDQTLIVVEVKTRIGKKFGLPEESITRKKLREVMQTAAYYKLLHPELPDRMRIDVIAIELAPDETLIAFRHIENVTF